MKAWSSVAALTLALFILLTLAYLHVSDWRKRRKEREKAARQPGQIPDQPQYLSGYINPPYETKFFRPRVLRRMVRYRGK